MSLASQSQTAPGLHRGLLRRSSQNSSSAPVIPQVQAVDFCRSEPRLVKLEQQLYSLACGDISSREVTETCLSLLLDCDKTKEVFNVFCSCSWVDRFQDPILSKLFYELVNIQQDSNADILLLAELEMACEELLKVLTHLGAPNTLQLNVVCLLYNLSRLTGLPPSHLEAVQSYLEEIARALWPYSLPSAPDLWGSEAFCDAQCDVLKACGKFLEEKCPVNTERMFQKINSKLISGDISQYARFRLLEIRELRSSRWKLSGTALNYYKAAYQKFKNQSKKNMSAAIDSTPCTKNGFKRIGSFGENSGQDNIKPVTVLRISENELRKSCGNLQEPFVVRDAVAEEANLMVDQRSCSSAHRIELPTQPRVSLSSGYKDFGNQGTSSKDDNLLITARQLSEKALASLSTVGLMESNLTRSKDSDIHVVDSKPKVDLEKENTTCSMSSASQDLTKGIVEHVSSPSSTCGEDSDDVFLSTFGRGKVMPAMHRGDFKKPRRPFKSDSSVSSATGSSVSRAPLLSDSSVGNYADDSKLVRSDSTEVVTSDDIKVIPYELSSGTNSFEAAIGSGDSDSNRKVDEEDCGAKTASNRKVDEEDCGAKTASNRKVDEEGCGAKTAPNRTVDEEDCGTKTASENWRVQKKTCSDEIPDVMSAGGNSAVENWRKRSLGDLTVSQSNSSSTANENWRGRTGNSSPDFWSSGSQNENWRVKKSMSVDETRQNANTTCTSSGQPKRYSLGDIQLERQDSNEKGKRSPGGGFGLPKQTSQDLEEATSDEQHEAPKSELLEVQLSEEESQGLRWRKLAEIQDDTGCKLFHDREKCTIVIKGDPLSCKAAKKRVYSVIAALQEEFGALVPLSDEILQHLQTEGRCMLAERLALCSGANVKMINDSQLFISGHRTCVNLAKTQLAKIKVMLKYTDDPDVASLSQQDSSEDVGGEQIQIVERLFAALEGRPRRFSQADVGSTDPKPQEGSLSREFLLSCASNPLAQQRPVDLSLERTEDWVTAIVLVNARRGDQVLLEQKKGFGSPNMDSTRTKHPLT